MTGVGDAGGLITGAVGLGVGLMGMGMIINMTNENVNRLIDKGKGRKPRKVKPIVTFGKMKKTKAKGKGKTAKNIKKRINY